MENNLAGTDPDFSISPFVLNLPRNLFAHLEEGVGPLLPSHQRVAMVLEVVRIEEGVREAPASTGRPPVSRKAGARALLSKAILNIPTRKDLVERLRVDARFRRICGFLGAPPSEATLCRLFAELAGSGLWDEALERAVKTHLGEATFHHVSHDSTAVPGRERTPRKPKVPKPKGPGRGGKRVKGATPPPTPQEVQEGLNWRECLAGISPACDYGVKVGPKGYPVYWRGYKGHASVGDGGIPLAFFTSSASTSDTVAAIPLMRMVAERVGCVFYNLLDKAYQGEAIRRVAGSLGQVAIVPPKRAKRDEPAPTLTPDRAKRFENRTAVERFYSDLKENHGGNFVFVRGKTKVHAHLMGGVLAIFGLRVLGI
ncbi:MAG: transposase [Fimbriimonas sp.]